jgi:hypothetical protein
MASRKPALRLLARTSRVSTVIAKHVISVFSRAWVSVYWVGILMVRWGSFAMHFYAPYHGISLFVVAVHLLRKGFIFVLADWIKEFVFTTHIPDTWKHGWERAAVSRKYYQPLRHPLTPAPGTFFPLSTARSILTLKVDLPATKNPSHAQLYLLMTPLIPGLVMIRILVPCHHCFS